MKIAFLILLLMLMNIAHAQIIQTKNVLSLGGNIHSSVYTSYAVIGQIANSKFSKNFYSGTIGYLDDSDNEPNEVTSVEKGNYKIEIYPNPSDREVYIDWNQLENTPVEIIVVNSLGVVLFQKNYENNKQHNIQLPKETFNTSGTYFVHLKFSNRSISKNFVIIR